MRRPICSAPATMNHELQDLRRELGRNGRGQGVWYPDALRERITAWASRRRADGATLREISVEIGISAESLRRWTLVKVGAAAQSLLPIEVVDDRDHVDDERESLRIITAAGHRIEGLTIADTIAVAPGLG